MKSARCVPQQVLSQAALIAWTARYGAVTPEALAEHQRMSVAEAAERLDEAVRKGLLKRESVLVGYSPLYTVSTAGRNLARRHGDTGGYVYPKGLRTPVVSIKETRHMIACAGVRAALERRYPGHRTIGELELRRDERERGRRLASVEIRGTGRRRSHSPDLVIWPPATLAPPVAVEVELTRKAKAELIANIRAWARCRRVEAVVYFAETRGIEEKLFDALEECRGEERIVVNPLREILKPQPGFPLIDE
jgi:hypothetical protein